jgi:SAM-dependent methyltransferase
MNFTDPAPIWHEVECGSYQADLGLWEELVEEDAEVVDLGCGTGRVATRLARGGRRVTAVDQDPQVLEVLERRVAERGLAVECVCKDVRELNLGRQFDAVLAPMQLVQLMRGEDERRAMLTRVVRHIRPSGLFAASLMDLEGEPLGEEYGPPPPDMREVDGWVYSSQSVAVLPIDRGRAIAIDRVRTAVAPDGEQRKSLSRVRLELVPPDVLEREMQAAGLVLRGRRVIPPTEEHVGSIVVIGAAPEATR